MRWERNRSTQRRKGFLFFLLSVISNHWGRQDRVISQRLQQFCPSWDYIIFPNCKWSLSIHQPMNQQQHRMGEDGGGGEERGGSSKTRRVRGIPLRKENSREYLFGSTMAEQCTAEKFLWTNSQPSDMNNKNSTSAHKYFTWVILWAVWKPNFGFKNVILMTVIRNI